MQKIRGTKDEYEISLYTEGELNNESIVINMQKLRTAFPKQSAGFFNILTERVIANGFTDERLVDAVNWLIDNFAYKELNIADIVRFDRRMKLYSYQEVARLVTENLAQFDDFEIREINGQKWRIKKSDLI